tara:strand:+ start:4610 stop:5233 length:624 start_codon:yes stop_codon:yes gene_type:complete
VRHNYESNFSVMFSVPPLMKAYYSHDDFDDIVNYVKGLEYETTNGSIDNSQSVDSFVLNKDIFSNLNEFIEYCVKEYTDKILGSDQKLNVTQSWVNRTKIGQEHHYHYHQNSILSGVFFLKSGSPITFLNNRNYSFHIEHKKYNQYNQTSYQYPAEPKILVLFPSYLPHYVPVNTNGDRYSLSFNTFPSGSFGSEAGLTYVNINTSS